MRRGSWSPHFCPGIPSFRDGHFRCARIPRCRLCALLSIAGIAGNTVNYSVGYLPGPKIAAGKKIRWVKQEYLDRTHRFYEKYGGKTIVIARFVPIIRTFAPFVAGVGTMTYGRFQFYNVIGCVAWILTFVVGGYYFGNIPIVKEKLHAGHRRHHYYFTHSHGRRGDPRPELQSLIPAGATGKCRISARAGQA